MEPNNEEMLTMSGKEHRAVLKRLFSYTKYHVPALILTGFLVLLVTLADVFSPILIKIFLDDYLTPLNFVAGPIIMLASGYIGLILGKSVVWYFQLMLFQKIALRIVQQIRIDIFSKLHKMGMRYFDQTPAGSLVSRVTNDTEAIKDMFINVLGTAIQSLFMLIGIYAAMFVLDAKLAAYSLLIFPLTMLIIIVYRKYSSQFYRARREKLSQLNAKIAESISGMSIVQQFNQEKRLIGEFEEINKDYYDVGMKNIKFNALLLGPAIDLLYSLAVILILSFFGIQSFSGPVAIGTIYAFVSYFDRFLEAIYNIMERLAMYQEAITAASRVFRIMDGTELAPAQEDEEDLVIEKAKIEFKNVTFSYDGKKDVLKDISFTAESGQTVALVGHTGSGKSSIINLMMRFYEFEHGEILIDGKSIKRYPMEELRMKTGLVLQDSFMFYGTIKDNIRLYNKLITDREIVEAAQFVQADRFINTLADKYDHKVIERGASFSSGQRQLISFARTVVTNPQILVLDEATANIDTETESLIQTGLRNMRQGRTTIAIAHRLSTIKDADLILVLSKGRIIERGTHDLLLDQGGVYHSMYQLQNSGMDLEDIG
ncbi:ABC transporter ATP-binding protein [Listeria weihenstephanensis]|uniref:ABC transporter ATP-binding protein n=1 Tax=Listeria weihenstephanensis TaxID=1006155 RepID=A0A841Z3W4_9LIST|nr:ABC transporter ATP-binding protein [Listeria weihenstephanensis]MBC1499960.1 ABC transporter ATP-binding protein [Listeria weihenstephanensis]